VGKIVQAVLAVAGRRYGYQVTVDVTSGDLVGSGLVTGEADATSTAPAGDTVVLVRVMSLSNGLTYASHLCTAPDETEAVRAAGLWAAGYILNRSSRIPHWAAWQADTAHALVTAKNAAEHTIPALKAALADAPNSGILLVRLGHHYELQGQPLDATECYARAVTAYPRYSVARYRLAVALASLRHDRGWRSASQIEGEDAVRRAVKAAVEALGVDSDNPVTNLEDNNPARQSFTDLASVLLRALEADTWLPYRLAGAFRRSERESVWPALLPMSQHPAARFPALVKSARQALGDDNTPRAQTQRAQLDHDAGKEGSWWQISYNAACAHAANIAAYDGGMRNEKQREAELALNYLEQTLVRTGVEQLSANWVSHDPDLAPLRDLPRFQRFVAQLRPGG
jgi:tetratricopeptide (TPR) repeat protein